VVAPHERAVCEDCDVGEAATLADPVALLVRRSLVGSRACFVREGDVAEAVVRFPVIVKNEPTILVVTRDTITHITKVPGDRFTTTREDLIAQTGNRVWWKDHAIRITVPSSVTNAEMLLISWKTRADGWDRIKCAYEAMHEH
jgi:hypothetical protein